MQAYWKGLNNGQEEDFKKFNELETACGFEYFHTFWHIPVPKGFYELQLDTNI